MTREALIAAQTDNVSLSKCFAAALSPGVDKSREATYTVENGLLMRRWTAHRNPESEWSVVCQIVVPTPYRRSVLSLAHDHL